jgi:uncharacterized membrane protein YdjX (TVP38/TMEM64 family)
MDTTDSVAGANERHRLRRKAALIACGVGLLVLAGLALAQPPEVWGALKGRGVAAVDWVRGLGAGWYFAAFAVLPAVGFPVSAFAFSAGPLFGPVLGLPVVLGLAGASMATSMTISYGLARHVLRPWVTRLLGYLGYVIPVVPAEKQRMFVFLVRVTPGPPYVFQSFLLGLADVPFWLYLWLSWVVATANISLVIVFGDALMKGHFKKAMAALIGVVAVVAVVKILRKRALARVASGEAA